MVSGGPPPTLSLPEPSHWWWRCLGGEGNKPEGIVFSVCASSPACSCSSPCLSSFPSSSWKVSGSNDDAYKMLDSIHGSFFWRKDAIDFEDRLCTNNNSGEREDRGGWLGGGVHRRSACQFICRNAEGEAQSGPKKRKMVVHFLLSSTSVVVVEMLRARLKTDQKNGKWLMPKIIWLIKKSFAVNHLHRECRSQKASRCWCRYESQGFERSREGWGTQGCL